MRVVWRSTICHAFPFFTQTWRIVAGQLAHRCGVVFQSKTLTEFAQDSMSVAARMVEALAGGATLILTVHNDSGGYHDVVIAGYEGFAAGLVTRFVQLDPLTENASVAEAKLETSSCFVISHWTARPTMPFNLSQPSSVKHALTTAKPASANFIEVK